MRLIEHATPKDWCAYALANPGALLLDHLHCEMKAATVALSLVSKNPHIGELVAPLIHLAEEELAHYRAIHEVLLRRRIHPEPISTSPYMRELRQRAGEGRGQPLLDRLLVAALIEARSCERFQLLIGATEHDPELSRLFQELMASEARHTSVYVDLAKRLFGSEAVERRLAPLAKIESRLMAELPPASLLHSGWNGALPYGPA